MFIMLHRRFFQTFIAVIAAISLVFSQSHRITILHTNDIHASFIPHEALWMKQSPKPLIGGFKELFFKVDSIRNVEPATLLLDAGDVMTGNPITEYSYDGADGGALFEMMNRIGYEAWTLGNHDFDISQSNLKKLTAIAHFPTVSANILDSAGSFPVGNKEYVLIEKGGLTIGIIGLMSKDFYDLVNRNSSRGIKLLPPIETAKRLSAELYPKTDLLIAITHEGIADDEELARQVSGIDVIIGGHSHTRLQKPKVVNGTIIVQTGSNCENLGELDLTVEKHHIPEFEGKLLPLWCYTDRLATPLSRLVDSIKTEIDKAYAEEIGTLKSDWTINQNGESSIGDFIADAQREAAHADVGFMNTHGMRKNLPAGAITKRDLFEILPFRNILTRFELTGEQLRRLVEEYVLKHHELQTSGIQAAWRRGKNKEIEFIKFTVGDKPFDEKGIYSIGASDYLAGEISKNLNGATLNVTYLNETVFAVVEKKIKLLKEVDSENECRIVKIK